MAIVRQVASTATLVHWEMQIRSRWFECWFYPVLRPDKPVSEVALYAREITQQKKSQAELSKLFQAIQQSPTSVVITDRDGNIEYVNPKFTEVTGYTQAEAIGQNPRILKSGHTPPEQYTGLWKTISFGRCVARRISQQEEERRAVLGTGLDCAGQGRGEDDQFRRR